MFYGKPIIAWSIEAALQSNCFDEVVVSSDDEEIAEIARQYGANTPFIRPAELSDDYTGTIPVIAHSVRWYIEQGYPVTHACCIYATAPFVCAENIQQGLKVLENSGGDYSLSVTSYPFPIQRAVRITACHKIQMFEPENFNKRSQDLEEAYHDAGQFYWGLQLLG